MGGYYSVVIAPMYVCSTFDTDMHVMKKKICWVKTFTGRLLYTLYIAASVPVVSQFGNDFLICFSPVKCKVKC